VLIMRLWRRVLLFLAIPLAAQATTAWAQRPAGAPPPPANRPVYLDKDGVIRWKDDRKEVTLFGANYVVTTASDYRAAG
jgi:hypothetical protein